MDAVPPQAAAYQLWRAGRFADAVPFAEKAAAVAQACVPVHGLLATLLLQLGRSRDAEAVASAAEALPQGTADGYDGLAYVWLALGAHARANSCYRRAVHANPQDPKLLYNLACSERSFGRLAEAEALCDRAIGAEAAHYPAYLLRAELRVQAAGANHVAQLEARLHNAGNDARARIFLGYALGKELNDLNEFDRAFAAFSLAARARRECLQYDVSIDEQKLARIAQVFPGDMGAVGADPGESARFIFVIGLPRSGTTLVERILGGLPGARSNGETENFSRSLLSAAARGPGDVFERAAAADPARVGADYAQRADLTRSGEHIIEKLPLNYLYLGAIRRALPQARILCVERMPIDSCFAMYRTLFGEAYPFSYDLEELARYQRAYARLMAHWHATLEGLYTVSYEELVRDPARVAPAMAAACGLPWRESALEIQRNAAVSLTASASQVRRPIYGTSSGRWRHYERHLAPLIHGLQIA